MTEITPKRYAHTLIIHFVLFSLFLPTFRSEYWHAYYQDFFISNFIGAFIIVNILSCRKLTLKPNGLPAILLTVTLALYNAVLFYIYHTHKDRYFWKNDHFNVTLAFLLLIVLLLSRDVNNIISGRTIKWTIGSILVSNLIGLSIRVRGYSHIQMMNFIYWKVPYDESNNFFGWFSADASEYAFLLLLEMGFFIVYKKQFKNVWSYCLSQFLLIVCLILTNSATFLLAAFILFGCQLIDYAVHKYNIPSKYVRISFPVAAAAGGFVFYLLFKNVDTFHTKYLIWKGSWKLLLDDPMGLGTTFGVANYFVEGVEPALDQAHNVFLNHMLRHSLGAGALFTLMFAILFISSILRHPTYRTIGIWTALLIPLNMNYALQTVHLPFTLFMLYCIFFKPEENSENTKKASLENVSTFDILDLDNDTIPLP